MKKIILVFVILLGVSILNANTIAEADKAFANKNYNKAKEICTILAKKGVLEAQYKLGALYAMNNNTKKVLYWYKKVANSKKKDKFNTIAKFSLGVIYEFGKYGNKMDIDKAIFWYKKAAKDKFVSAYGNLGIIYKEGKSGEKDFEKAIYWFKKAAKLKHIESQYNLGIIYGLLAPRKNPKKAIFWYKKVANNGNILAQHNLGVIYIIGDGVKKESKKALYWFKKSANQGYANSEYSLGVLYHFGEKGIVKDIEKATYWYKKAANKGHIKAIEKLNNINGS